MKWETVIGLEVHTELATKSKIFCGCSTAYSGGANTHVCPGCAGMPGALPVLNRSVVEFAMRLGIALHCDITQNCSFDRKSYFYPDLPNAYQITQFYSPICRNGYVEIDIDGKKKKIGLKQIHMEEDAGKLVHDPYGTRSFIDLNRCSMPLLEIVSLPDLRGPDEVIAYMEKLREIMLYLEVSDCKMQEGSIRADINLSVRQPGEGLGVRTEMKNMNSFKAIVRAIEFENYRHIEALEDGTPLYQETRRWDDEKGESYAMRNKENAQDYRYFPDPDLPSLRIDDAWLERVRTELPELAE
ncbi:MAG: Asp-tRNA(Asn)/Glu-tRNA(Gln) amidotransferase subunit GatB, partial [Treponema sp.]|nr:Asp-tRNA(Asn)/Glu-tRNA(Gln) amidotransferase subunit GatB [Treponema sp.]